ncbi:MAG: ATP-binding cassette domain-containing protein [Anaerolineaceae bacterium]
MMQVSIQSLQHTFPGNPPRHALQDVSVEIPAGSFVAIVGPSGCGKSTLLRLVAGLIMPRAGRISFGNQSIEDLAVARKIAWMAQSPALLPWLTARANVALAQRLHHNGYPLRLSPDEALQRVGLGDAADSYPFMLSGGMQQRLALARTLTLEAELWLMDEPFAALDELTRERLTHELAAIWEPLRPTVLWVTHNIYEALRLADRVLVFSRPPGRLIADLPVRLPRRQGRRAESAAAFQGLLVELRTALGLHREGAR